MTTDVRRRITALGAALALAVGGWQVVERISPPPADGVQQVEATEPVAAVRRAPSPWSWWRPTTTTARPVTATTRLPTTTTRPPTTTTTTRPPTTTTRPPTTTTRPPAPTTTAPPPPPPPTTVTPVGGLSSAVLDELLALVNATRAVGTTCGGTFHPAAPPLALQSQISAAADAHARDMAARNYFSHTGANGSDPGQRLTAAGYRWSAWGENIAAGQPTPASVIASLFSSPGHCVNFMSRTVTQIGFGKAENPASAYRIYWVADLGRPA